MIQQISTLLLVFKFFLISMISKILNIYYLPTTYKCKFLSLGAMSVYLIFRNYQCLKDLRVRIYDDFDQLALLVTKTYQIMTLPV